MGHEGAADLDGLDLVGLAPLRCARWRERGEVVVIERPRPEGRGLAAARPWIAYWLAPRRIRLDDMGSFVWHRLDGRATLSEIARAVGEAYPDDAQVVEERVEMYVRMLHAEGLVTFPGLVEP